MGRESLLRQRERDFYKQGRRDRGQAKPLIHGEGKDKRQSEIVPPGASDDAERNALIDEWSKDAV